MTAATVHEKDDCPGTVEDGFVLGPTAGDEDRLDARQLAQALRHELAAGVELMVARAVAGPAGDQDDLGGVGGLDGFDCEEVKRRCGSRVSRFRIGEFPGTETSS